MFIYALKVNVYCSCLVGFRWSIYHPYIQNNTNKKPHQPRNILTTTSLRFCFWKQLSGSISTILIHSEVFQQQQRWPLTVHEITACNVNFYTYQITQCVKSWLYGQSEVKWSSDALYMSAQTDFHLEDSQEQAVTSSHYLSPTDSCHDYPTFSYCCYSLVKHLFLFIYFFLLLESDKNHIFVLINMSIWRFCCTLLHASWLSDNTEEFSLLFLNPPMTFSDSQCQTSSNDKV